MLTLVLLAENRTAIICIPSVDINVHDRPLGRKAAEGKKTWDRNMLRHFMRNRILKLAGSYSWL